MVCLPVGLLCFFSFLNSFPPTSWYAPVFKHRARADGEARENRRGKPPSWCWRGQDGLTAGAAALLASWAAGPRSLPTRAGSPPAVR